MSRITQKGATGPLALTANGAFQTSTDTDLVTLLGSRWDLSDGREVVLVNAATNTTVAIGKLYQNTALVAANQNIAVTAFTAYSSNGNVPAKVTVTVGETVIANQYRGGYLVVNDNAGEGQTLKIASHPAAAGSAACVITLEDAPNTALTTASEVCLIPAVGANIIINPTTPTNAAIGIALCPIAAGAYGFLVSKGLTSALSDATAPGAGVAISASTSTAGAIGVFSTLGASGSALNAVIGSAVQAGVSTEYRTVFIDL